MQVGGDLVGRASLLEQLQDLRLARRQIELRHRRRLPVDVRDLAEHTDHPVAAHQGHRADLDAKPLAVSRDNDGVEVGHDGVSRHLAREHLANVARLLVGDERRELPSTDVADDPLPGLVDPADDSGRIEDVSRDAHVLERGLQAGADRREL